MSGFPQTAPALAQALAHTRVRTLALMDAWCTALPGLRVPLDPTLNLPLWEWGHVAWFQSWWIGRNHQRALGRQCDPDHERWPATLPHADALFNSSTVPHASRWELPLPSLEVVKGELARSLDETLRALEEADRRGEDLYFWQLVLVHEDMHNEAALYMAQALDLHMPPGPAQGHAVMAHPLQRSALAVPAQRFRMGHDGREHLGFAFDNEWQAHEVSLEAFEIDDRPVSWADYLAFAQDTGHALPSVVRREGDAWLFRRFGRWEPLDLQEPACYLEAADAQAWCNWAGRALPTEAQWECAARHQREFTWGAVWEWTATVFEPYPGFTAHPYRDYSEPWFGTHRVLRGASTFTDARMVNPTYRNFFLPERCDIPAGFRTVARA
jgi:EgtB-related family protein